ncbi:MAG: VOC family protein [Pseudomonadota bacterium]
MAVFPEQRLSIITLGVKDRAAMTAFYEDVIGFKNVGPEGMAMFNMGGFVLGLWEADKLADDAGQPARPAEGFRNAALAYNARSEADVDEIFARLKAANVKITTPPHKAFWGGYSGYFADPEGNAWEVAYNPYWTFDEAGRVVLPSGDAD